MWVAHPDDGRILTANEAAWTHYGYAREAFLRLRVDDLRETAGPGAAPADQGIERALERHRTQSGAWIDVETASQWTELDGQRVRLVVVRDVTAERRAEAERRASEARLRAIFDHAAVGIALHDGDGFFVEANPAMERLFGYSVAELQTMRAVDLAASGASLAGVYNQTVEQRFTRRDGSALLGELTTSRIESAEFSGTIAMVQDVTERKRLEAELAHSARHDVLTGLANRALLRERAAAVLDPSNERRDAVALLFIDLDDFKTVNDSLGHAEGDRLLREIAHRLGEVTRGTDTVARLGGDEFAILLEDAPTADLALDAAAHVLTALRRPVALRGAEVVVGGSIGVARAADSEGVDALLRNADVAMYRAKQIGKGTAELFAPEMHSAVVDRLELEADLRASLAAGDLRVAYQPIVELATARAVGVECLVRWLHPQRGPVSPGVFIPLAEQTGLIVQLGRIVLREACRQGAVWLAAACASGREVPHGEAPFTITVNISSRQLLDDQLVGDVAAALAETGFDPRCLVLEITESVVMQRIDTALAHLHALKALGVRLAIDDFGTGYSSLAYLQRLPIDVIKLDKSFVDGVTRSARDAALVRTIIALGEMLGLRCIAEGVEHAEQRAHLESLGCTYGQGYLFAPALPPGGAELVLGLAGGGQDAGSGGRRGERRSAHSMVTAAS
jgi:diguanylate cyclase (GGDEF)-like protein/PAS domain S-box-containing protein